MSLVNVSIDDISPHPKSSTKVLERCFELIEVFPDIKFTLFIPMNYQRMDGRSYPLTAHDDFCEELRKLPRSNFEFGWHGFDHGIPMVSNNDEFKDMTYEDANEALIKMFQEANLSEISDIFSSIFRPSAFRMSPDTFNACCFHGLQILALSDDPLVAVGYGGEDKKYKDVVYYNVNPPLKPLKLFDRTEIVYHACEWDRSYLDEEKTTELRDFCFEHKENIKFTFMKGIVDGSK